MTWLIISKSVAGCFQPGELLVPILGNSRNREKEMEARKQIQRKSIGTRRVKRGRRVYMRKSTKDSDEAVNILPHHEGLSWTKSNTVRIRQRKLNSIWSQSSFQSVWLGRWLQYATGKRCPKKYRMAATMHSQQPVI